MNPQYEIANSLQDIHCLPPHVLEEVFRFLDGRTAASAVAVCRMWRELLFQADWKQYYRSLWRMPSIQDVERCRPGGVDTREGTHGGVDTREGTHSGVDTREGTHGGVDTVEKDLWRRLFHKKLQQVMGYQYKPDRYTMYGHKSGVKVAKLIPECHTMLTGSVDRRLICWELDNFSHVGVSLPHGGTVRCVAFDDDVLLTGSTDHRIRMWRAVEQEGDDDVVSMHHRRKREAKKFPFKVSGSRIVLSDGHHGPVSSLQLTETALFSGSWDYRVCVWDRTSVIAGEDYPGMQCIQSLHFDDWVLDLKMTKQQSLLVAAGSEVHLVDVKNGEARKTSSVVHTAHRLAPVTALEVSEDGRMLCYGTGDGSIHLYDLRCHGKNAFLPSYECSSAVTGLSWEYPWLAASLQNGEVTLVNTDSPSRNKQPYYARVLVGGGTTGGAQCVDIADGRIVAGFEDGSVVTWDFANAEKAARELKLLRQRKKAAREARRTANK